jgi:PRTRC genetic system protein E
MIKFFTDMETLLEGFDLTLTLAKKGELLSLSVLPVAKCKDDAKSNIRPLLLTGTAQELDEGFIDAITAPLKRVSGIILDIQSFEEGLQKLEEESSAKDAAAKLREKEEEEKKKAEIRKNKKYVALIKKAEELVEKNELKQAIGAYKEAKELSSTPQVIEKKIESLVIKISSAGSLFDSIEEAKTISTNFGSAIDIELDNETEPKPKAAPTKSTKSKKDRKSKEVSPDVHHEADLKETLQSDEDVTTENTGTIHDEEVMPDM